MRLDDPRKYDSKLKFASAQWISAVTFQCLLPPVRAHRVTLGFVEMHEHHLLYEHPGLLTGALNITYYRKTEMQT